LLNLISLIKIKESTILKSTDLRIVILLPCLNESETLAVCIKKAQSSITKSRLKGEVLVADNGSTDGSQQIAKSLGARLITVREKGYGSALIAGIEASKSEFIIMGDADDSYALDALDEFIQSLLDGNELVMGNRFQGGVARGAMPWLHKYIGNPVLSWLGRLFFKIPIGDFHCGLRGFNTEAIRGLNLKSTGMEFASEMIVKASLNGLKIAEVPTTLKPDGRSRAPHLRTWRDGWRHLVFLLAASPRWLFLYPGIFLSSFGLLGILLTSMGPIDIGHIQLDLNSFLFSIGLVFVGTQTVLFGILARIFSTNFGTLPESKSTTRFADNFSLERGIVLGLFLLFASLIGALALFRHWNGSSLMGIQRDSALRISGLIILTSGIGVQTLFASFFASMLQSKRP
jgi:glycosyltransferase involved in cell wall biosynthesis